MRAFLRLLGVSAVAVTVMARCAPLAAQGRGKDHQEDRAQAAKGRGRDDARASERVRNDRGAVRVQGGARTDVRAGVQPAPRVVERPRAAERPRITEMPHTTRPRS